MPSGRAGKKVTRAGTGSPRDSPSRRAVGPTDPFFPLFDWELQAASPLSRQLASLVARVTRNQNNWQHWMNLRDIILIYYCRVYQF